MTSHLQDSDDVIVTDFIRDINSPDVSWLYGSRNACGAVGVIVAGIGWHYGMCAFIMRRDGMDSRA